TDTDNPMVRRDRFQIRKCNVKGHLKVGCEFGKVQRVTRTNIEDTSPTHVADELQERRMPSIPILLQGLLEIVLGNPFIAPQIGTIPWSEGIASRYGNAMSKATLKSAASLVRYSA